MEKLARIENREIGLKCSAGTVRAYRDIFGKDLILDMAALEKELIETKTLQPESAKAAEQIVWLMAKEYDGGTPPIDEFLGQFSPYFVYNAVAQAIYMWRENTKTLNESKKNSAKRIGSGLRRFFSLGRRS